MQAWIGEQRALSGRLPRRYASIEDAFKRMQEANRHLSPEQARHLTQYGVNQNEDGTYSWKFDNYVRADPPYEMTDYAPPARYLPAVLAADGVLVVESSSRVEPELPLAKRTSRRYGSARLTLFEHE